MAYVYRRPGSPYWYMAWRDEFGRLHRDSSEERLKGRALRKAVALEEESDEVRIGRRRRPQLKTWEQLCGAYRANVLPGLRGSSARSSLGVHLEPAFAGRALHTVGAEDIDGWVARLRGEGYEPSTQAYLLSRMSALFGYAVRLKWLAVNPASEATPVRVPEKEPPFLTREEVVRLLTVAPEWFRPIVVLALFLGLRRGELAGLQWEDVDLPARTLRVRRSFGGPTKGSREATLPLPEAAVPFLERHRQRARPGCPWVFPNRQGKRRHSSWGAAVTFRHWCRQAGITRHVVFHDTRHTWATHTYAQTKDMRAVQAMARHSDMRVTQRYAHLLPGALVEAANRLDYGPLHIQRTNPAARLPAGKKKASTQEVGTMNDENPLLPEQIAGGKPGKRRYAQPHVNTHNPAEWAAQRRAAKRAPAPSPATQTATQSGGRSHG